MTESEYNELLEKLRNEFQPRMELLDNKKAQLVKNDLVLPDINTVNDFTTISFIEKGVRYFYQAVNGQWIKR